MPPLQPPNAVASALTDACEILFAMMARDTTLFPLGEHLVLALLDGAEAQGFGGTLVVQRLRSRLAAITRATPRAAPQGPRNG